MKVYLLIGKQGERAWVVNVFQQWTEAMLAKEICQTEADKVYALQKSHKTFVIGTYFDIELHNMNYLKGKYKYYVKERKVL